MSKDPAFLFYSSDFLTGTTVMTDEQVGKYIRLMCLQHQQGHLAEKHMLSICKAYDEDVFSKFTKDDNGLFYNERLDYEIERRRKYTESRRNNASKKKSKDNPPKAYAKHMDEHMENENETIIDNNKDLRPYDGASEKIQSIILEWLAYKREKKNKYTERGWESLMNKFINMVAKYGEDAVCEVVQDSMANNYQGIVWDRLAKLSVKQSGGWDKL